jgi:multiple antibiotic resistance protein
MSDAHFIITAFATALTIVDPLGMVPLSLTVTAHAAPDARRRIINLAVLVAALVIAFMGLLGRYVLQYLNITLPAFTIAGGILLLLVAIDMLFGRPSGTRVKPEEEQEALEHENPAVFPLAIPMLAGPGTIATVLLLVNLAGSDKMRLATVFGAYAVALLAAWLCMHGAQLILRWIGKTGVGVMTRLLGIILAALAVQFIINGLVNTPLLRH